MSDEVANFIDKILFTLAICFIAITVKSCVVEMESLKIQKIKIERGINEANIK